VIDDTTASTRERQLAHLREDIFAIVEGRGEKWGEPRTLGPGMYWRYLKRRLNEALCSFAEDHLDAGQVLTPQQLLAAAWILEEARLDVAALANFRPRLRASRGNGSV
jgi:hypothetical protein